MSAAAVIARRRRRLVRRFREAGATDPEHAVTLEDIGERRSWIFDQMAQHEVFIPVHAERFYMNESAANEFLRERRFRALLIGTILLIVFLLLWLSGCLTR